MPVSPASRLLRFDRQCASGTTGLVGVDEVGRGALAGPVVACALWLSPAFLVDRQMSRRFRLVNDSKVLRPSQRLAMFRAAERVRAEGGLDWVIEEVGVPAIEERNILGATRLAMQRALGRLEERAGLALARVEEVGQGLFEDHSEHRRAPTPVLIDGKPLSPFAYVHEAIVQGDGRSFAIALASVLAKVHRDQLMELLDRRFPQFGMANHKGYGTPEHVAALRVHGPCPEHRSLFIRSVFENHEAPGQVRFAWASEEVAAELRHP